MYIGIPLECMKPFMHNLTQTKVFEIYINPYFHPYGYLKSALTRSYLNFLKHFEQGRI